MIAILIDNIKSSPYSYTHPDSVEEFHSDLKRYLKYPGNHVDDETPFGHRGNLLYHAVKEGKKEIVPIILSEGATIDQYIIDIALKKAVNNDPNSIEVLQYLFNKLLEKFNKPKSNAVAILGNLIKTLKEHAPSKAQNILNKALLNYASPKNRSIIRWLLEKGADPNCTDNYIDDSQRTPLMRMIEARGNKKLKALKLFFNNTIKNKVNLDQQDSVGWSALHAAIGKRNLEITEFLIEKKASLDIHSVGGVTPLSLAVEGGCKKITTLLLAQRPDSLPKERKNRAKALNLAITNPKKSMVSILIHHGVELRGLPQDLSFSTQTRFLKILGKAWRCVPNQAPIRRDLIKKHNNSVLLYGQVLAEGLAKTPLPASLAQIVSSYLFKDAPLKEVYDEVWHEKSKILGFSPDLPTAQKRSHACLEKKPNNNRNNAKKLKIEDKTTETQTKPTPKRRRA